MAVIISANESADGVFGIDPDGYNYFQFHNKYSQDSMVWKPNIDSFYHGKALA
jgi:hypothetical protein